MKRLRNLEPSVLINLKSVVRGTGVRQLSIVQDESPRCLSYWKREKRERLKVDKEKNKNSDRARFHLHGSQGLCDWGDAEWKTNVLCGAG